MVGLYVNNSLKRRDKNMASIEDVRQKLKETNLTKIFFTDLNGRIMTLPINPEFLGW